PYHWAPRRAAAPLHDALPILALRLPPLPPLASALSMASPPLMRTPPLIEVLLFVVSEAPPPKAPTATATPPVPPAPAVRRAVVRSAESTSEPESASDVVWPLE